MKRSTLLLFLGTIIGAVAFLEENLSETLPAFCSPDPAADTVALRDGRRPSIAFILGEDKEQDNPYYREALNYYAKNREGKTDFVVSSCRSLQEVKKYLVDHAEVNAQPWGDIHLIAHGNQWSGLSVKVTPDSKRATTQRIVEHTQAGDFYYLEANVLDNLTRIFLHSCGVGNDQQLVDAVGWYFGGQQDAPTVYATRLFEFYASADGKKTNRFMAESWLLSYKMGERPSNMLLMNELREKYTDASIDWQGALMREQPRWIGDTYHYTFEVPVKWVVPTESQPDLSEPEQQLAWLQNQPAIVNELERLNLPVENFKWTFTKGYAEGERGPRTQAVNVKGYCTMLCVVKALTEGDGEDDISQEPLRPPFTDPHYYYATSRPLLATI